jgi:hypothetical protein
MLWLLRVIVHASGRQGVPRANGLSPVFSHVYLTEVDRMLERAKAVTRHQQPTYVEYARFVADVVVLRAGHHAHHIRWRFQTSRSVCAGVSSCGAMANAVGTLVDPIQVRIGPTFTQDQFLRPAVAIGHKMI